MKLSFWMFGVYLLVASGWASSQEAPIYRWKDASGLTNYGTQPPPGVEAVPIGDRGTVSVVPPPPWLTPEALEERAKRERDEQISRLRSQVEREQRQRESLQERLDTRQDCEREYGVACDDTGRPLAEYSRSTGSGIWLPPGYYYPPSQIRPPIGHFPPGHIRPPHRPPPGGGTRPPEINPPIPSLPSRPVSRPVEAGKAAGRTLGNPQGMSGVRN